jgi:hypothetical protein
MFVRSCAAGRDDFPAFPYEPYKVQQDFMQHLYSVLQRGGVGLMESPTGTRLLFSWKVGMITLC